MGFLKFVLSIIGVIVGFVIAVKVLVFLLHLVGIVLHLAWIAAVIAVFFLIGWVVFKIVVPGQAQHT